MYTIKQKEREALREISEIVQTLDQQDTLEKQEFNEAKSSVRKAQYLINLILDRWEEERTFA
ncbi:TPA: hypothetical protein DDZ10_04695 [Candidatus Uhrbacteria bacterium]|uniref:Uncharacterized protein n=1 Tax=Candidatus Uhrbacteria bacterium GW2011_GWC2_53_7 TaxID=1618986 RepID=A0A0G2AVT6_9BACT|nr:MAG: hypothetical protein UY82_C0004G0019 [Candidatus Uhrbacteria bacterium GW2011_GWC2_53_7]OGL72418.1 MAG: hypothetical protein A3D69_02395 [Candidatus Uhrbacteria bacterium RIFCSPHIGHO2_02_FULL_54_11]HBL39931.1 hypothetical protein [Candidatus Uhrbacteria bacterium]